LENDLTYTAEYRVPLIQLHSMEKSEILARVKEVVSEILKTEPSEITDNSNFIFDLGASSLQSVELVAGFEEAFDVEMDQDKALEVQNIEDAVNFIASYL
jgi:acyl carrier protein